MRQRQSLEKSLTNFKRMQQELEDSVTLIEMGEAEGDQSTVAEAEALLVKLDHEVQQRSVEALLSGDTGVATVDRKRWGMDGEVTLCVVTRTDAEANRLFEQVKGVFPASSAKPLRVETGSGKAYQAPTP